MNNQLSELIRARNGIKDIPPLSTNLGIEHWLPLLKSCSLYFTGYLEEFNGYGETLSETQYDFSKDFDSQSEDFHNWLWQQLSNS